MEERNLDLLDSLKDALTTDPGYEKYHCTKYNGITSNGLSAVTLFDYPNEDAFYDRANVVKLSRFCKVFLLRDTKDYVYLPFADGVVYILLIVGKADEDNEYTCYSNTGDGYILGRYYMLKSQKDELVKGSNVVVSVALFEEAEGPRVPLLRTIHNGGVIISRHKRLHKELPSQDWFSFYVEVFHCYTSVIYAVVDGAVLYANADYKTHCTISDDRRHREDVTDDCLCCHVSPQIRTFGTQVMENVECRVVRDGLCIEIKHVGKFGASCVGAYNTRYIKIAIGSVYDIILKQDGMSGKKRHSCYVYGIARR
ncbi:m137R [Myxoma virus]|uniref:Protein OPG181 n=3 Tax=Myxoma virus TaxID=10273 RepID=Q9Q8G4_MYXVL|nr:m137R [Myxoma virus]ACB28932.1 m137R [recombinant virus 6918VP60-T2]AAF15025.1 m137R [Myxoma virus]ACB28760.1 m137R [Myxoma virus]AFU77738.1 m137R [Myxoma virus]AFU78739.1 m137R [Myxoma virus]